MKKITLVLLTVAACMIFSLTAFAGTWKLDATGWWWDNGNGTWPASCWQWCDGNNDGIAECYYFNDKGYCLLNCKTPDNYQVNADGAWVENGIVQTKAVAVEKAKASINENIEGTYNLYALKTSTTPPLFASDFKLSGYITLKSDGTAKWKDGKKSANLDWYNDGDYICFDQNGSELEGRITNGVIEIYISDGAYYYVKANADTSWIGAMSSGQYALSLLR